MYQICIRCVLLSTMDVYGIFSDRTEGGDQIMGKNKYPAITIFNHLGTIKTKPTSLFIQPFRIFLLSSLKTFDITMLVFFPDHSGK